MFINLKIYKICIFKSMMVIFFKNGCHGNANELSMWYEISSWSLYKQNYVQIIQIAERLLKLIYLFQYVDWPSKLIKWCHIMRSFILNTIGNCVTKITPVIKLWTPLSLHSINRFWYFFLQNVSITQSNLTI